MGQKEVDAAAERILLRERATVLQKVVRLESEIDKLYRKRIAVLKRQLRGKGPITAKVRKEMRKLVAELQPVIEQMIEEGAIHGGQAAKGQFLNVFGADAEPQIKMPTDIESLSAAGARIRGTATADRVRLSRRLWRNHVQRGDEMAAMIQKSIRAGKGMAEIADEIIGLESVDFARRPPSIRMPKYMNDLRDAAKQAAEAGQPNLYDDAVKKFAKQIDKLDQAGGGYANSMRPVAKQLVKELKDATPAQIEKHVDRFMLDKARVHTKMIVRNETIEAYRDSYHKSTADKDFVKGYRWELGSRHPEPDECDGLAGQDLYGLGPGGYPVDSVPATPHPLDLCIQVAIIDRDHFKREIAKVKHEKQPPKPWLSGKKETSAEWYAKQTEATRQKILGPTRAKIFKSNPAAVLGKDGVPRRVKDALKRASK